jgi:SAM-dependent methyltransferase
MNEQEIFEKYIAYHGSKFHEMGFDSKVVWNRQESQLIRFRTLCRMITKKSNFSILDIGSGLSDLYKYLLDNGYEDFAYTGYEINSDMVNAVRKKYSGIRVFNGSYNEIFLSAEKYDYIVACGIHAFGESAESIQNYFLEKYTRLYEQTEMAMGINFLSIYSKNPDTLSVYHDPSDVLRICLKNFGPKVTLYHNYLPNDFTVIIEK